MNIKEVKEVFNWLTKNFEDSFSYDEQENIITGMKTIEVSMYDDNNGWIENTLYFNKQGNIIPHYARQLELKEQIKELEKELKKLQDN